MVTSQFPNAEPVVQEPATTCDATDIMRASN